MIKTGCKIDEVRVDGGLEALQKDLEYFKGIGMGAVEIPVHGVDAIKNGVLDRQRVKEVRDILASFGFDYSVHSPNPLNLMDEESIDQHMKVFRSSLEFMLGFLKMVDGCLDPRMMILGCRTCCRDWRRGGCGCGGLGGPRLGVKSQW